MNQSGLSSFLEFSSYVSLVNVLVSFWLLRNIRNLENFGILDVRLFTI